MMLFDSTQQSLELGLQGSSMRQRALAQNMANINTPGYRRVDVDFHAQLSSIMARNPSGQLAPANFSASHPAGDSAVRVDGNTVDVDQESSMIAENALEYQGYTALLAMRKRMLIETMRLNA
jgi:flagellar basal-body rod protein FlgB